MKVLLICQKKVFKLCRNWARKSPYWNGKKNIKNVNCFSINTITDIKNLSNEFKNKKILITGATGGIETV